MGQESSHTALGPSDDGYGTDNTAGSRQGDPMFLLRVLSRRRWTAAVTFAVVVVATILYTWTTVPVYEARVRVLTDSDRLNLVSVQDVVEQTRTDTQRAILESRWMARRTLESLKLLPVGNASAAGVKPRAGSTASSSLIRWLITARATVTAPYHWLTDPPPVVVDDVQSGETPAEARAIDGFLGGLLLPPPQTGLMDIGYRSTDPVMAARFANALTQAYIDQSLETRNSASKEVTDWLTARLNEQRKAIEASEQALQAFREKNGLAPDNEHDRSNPLNDKLGELTATVTRAKTATIEKEALYKQARALQSSPGALEMLPAMLQSPVVQQLRLELTNLQREAAQDALTLGDRHPEMQKVRASIQAAQARLQTEVDRAVESLGADLAAARETEARLERVAESEKRDAMAVNRKSVELGILEREVDGNRQIYQMLTQRARETNIAEKLQPRTIRVLDPAKVPLTPVSPDKPKMLAIGLLGGAVLGIAFAFALEFLDNRIKSPEEIESVLRLPFLGLVPAIAGGSNGAGPLLTSGVPPAFAEAIRSMRTSVIFSLAGAQTKKIVVTSASMGEGKTVISTNLAIALAQAGQRVLFIDADMRRPRAHHVFDVPQEPGLSNLLVGNAKFSEVTRQTSARGLWVVAAGHRPPNASELLGSKAFREFVAALENHFDWVVIDSPPVIAVTDAPVVAHAADGVVFVVGAEMVTQPIARRAIEQCRAANVNILGAVLNRVELSRHAYYYSLYYHRRYSAYYVDESSDSKVASFSG